MSTIYIFLGHFPSDLLFSDLRDYKLISAKLPRGDWDFSKAWKWNLTQNLKETARKHGIFYCLTA